MATMRKLALAVLCTAAGGLLLCAASAQAATRELSGSFGPGGPGVGVFAEPQGIAIDQSTGDVFVYEVGEDEEEEEGNVYKFNAAGEPEEFSALGSNVIEGVGGEAEESEIAVDSSSGPDAGDIYVDTGAEVKIFSEGGVEIGVLTKKGEPCGVAVDAGGEVYVAFYDSEAIKRYTPETNPVSEADYNGSLPEVGEVCNIAADSAGDVYAAEYGGGTVTEYEASQFNTEEEAASGTVFDEEEEGGLAVDPVSGDVYIDERSDVAEYEASGKRLRTFGELSESLGVAVSDLNGEAYVTDGTKKGEVEIFGPLVVAPEARTAKATSLTRTSATLHGSVNPEGTPITVCEFEYGTAEGAYGHTAACEQGTPIEGSEPVPVSARLAGLAAGVVYHYRLVAGAEDGSRYYGLEEEFELSAAVEGVQTSAATEVLQTSATLNGSLEPNGFETHYFFEYGESTNYASTTATEDAGELSEVKHVSTPVAGLEPNKTYHFRLAAENSLGTTHGSDATFTTEPAPPAIHASAVVTLTTAALTGTLNPENSRSRYHFVYGPTESYGQSTPETEVGSSFGEVVVDGGVISELQPGTTLHYKLIATNQAGTVESLDQTLTTAAATGPTAITAGASGVSQSAATISGTVATSGLRTEYGFEIGTEAGNYGPATGLGSLGGATTETVTLSLEELQPATTYHYRVFATSVDGTSYGEAETFTTPGFPTLLTPPTAPALLAVPSTAFPAASQTNTAKPVKKQTKAQKLKKALKKCKMDKKKGKRTKCEKAAHKKYGKSKTKKKKK